MSAAPQIRTALTENLKELHLPAMRECFEQAAHQAEKGRLTSEELAELYDAGTLPKYLYDDGIRYISVKYGPELSHLNLWYRQGGARIRRWYQDREMPDLILQPSRGTLVATVDDRSHLTAEQVADLIFERMADRVRA
jgi:hypothetical protein